MSNTTGTFTVKYVSADGKEFESKGSDIEDIALTMRKQVADHETAIVRCKVQEFADSKGWPVAFSTEGMFCHETCPVTYSATGILTIGDTKLLRRFSHWDQKKMMDALFEDAHKMFKNQMAAV